MKVKFHPLAESELIAATLYLEKEAGLGADFLDAYEAWEAKVVIHPESCPEIGLGIRKGILPRFNYLIGYKITGITGKRYIRILYIRHYAQNRKDWGRRK